MNAVTVSLLFGLLAVFLPHPTLATTTCKDSDGNFVDWYFMYKTPQVSTGKGYGFVYYDSNGKTQTGDLGNNNTALKNTIYQLGLYGHTVDRSTVGWVIWNDQTYVDLKSKVVNHEQDDNGKYYAHSKGLIGFDANTGFWLAHSTPGFPFDHKICPDHWYFPYSQTMFAQHFFCISINSSSLNSIGTFMQQYHAYLYDVNLPHTGSWGTNFKSFAAGNFKESVDTSFTLTSLKGVEFKGFSKNGATHSDLWEDYVAPGLKTGIIVEGWCCGTFEGDCCNPSHCAGDAITDPSEPEKKSGQTHYPYAVVDIQAFKFSPNDYFETKNNHAKFALGTGSQPWFCAGDINRMDSQRLRGGGALCMQERGLYTWLKSSITAVNRTCSN